MSISNFSVFNFGKYSYIYYYFFPKDFFYTNRSKIVPLEQNQTVLDTFVNSDFTGLIETVGETTLLPLPPGLDLLSPSLHFVSAVLTVATLALGPLCFLLQSHTSYCESSVQNENVMYENSSKKRGILGFTSIIKNSVSFLSKYSPKLYQFTPFLLFVLKKFYPLIAIALSYLYISFSILFFLEGFFYGDLVSAAFIKDSAYFWLEILVRFLDLLNLVQWKLLDFSVVLFTKIEDLLSLVLPFDFINFIKIQLNNVVFLNLQDILIRLLLFHNHLIKVICDLQVVLAINGTNLIFKTSILFWGAHEKPNYTLLIIIKIFKQIIKI